MRKSAIDLDSQPSKWKNAISHWIISATSACSAGVSPDEGLPVSSAPVEIGDNVAETADSYDEVGGIGVPVLVSAAPAEELIEASTADDCATLESDGI